MQIRGGKLEYNNNNEKNNKVSKIILILIVLVFILIVAIIGTIMYIQNTAFKVYIDGNIVSMNEGIIQIDEQTGKVYIDIKGIASYLGYSAHNGEYKVDSEDTNKCWVECKNETASFFLNSNKISKVAPNSDSDYEDFVIEEPIISRNGKLYATTEAIGVGYNVTINYNKQSNSIQFYTLPYLVNLYGTKLKSDGFLGSNQSYKNQKSILQNLFIVKKSNNLYGVINSSGEEIISPKYKSIEYNESGKEFYVKNSSNKVGIVTNTGDTKINLIYDEINMIDKQSGLYIVKSGDKYGVLDNAGNIIVHLEYENIGLNTSKFSNNNISNKYLIYETLIPVYQNKKWGFFNTKGEIVIPVEFDEVGCTKGTKGSKVNNVLIIPNYKLIVLGKLQDDEKTMKYSIYNNLGKRIVPYYLDTVYSITSAGKNIYYMEYEEQAFDIEKYITEAQ